MECERNTSENIQPKAIYTDEIFCTTGEVVDPEHYKFVAQRALEDSGIDNPNIILGDN